MAKRQGGGDGGLQELGDGALGEDAFGGGGGVIELSVEGAEVGSVDAEGAGADAAGGVGDADDFEEREGGGVAFEEESAVEAALGGDDTGAAEGLEDLGEVTGGDSGGVGDLLCGLGFAGGGGEAEGSAEAVFGGLGDHFFLRGYLDLDIQISSCYAVIQDNFVQIST